MSDEDKPKSFEETLRAIADEVTRGIERVQHGELEDIAREYGVDADRAKRFMDNAGDWLRAQAERSTLPPFRGRAAEPESRPAEHAVDDFPAGAGPDPLDVPTEDQGRALAALDSGRWTVEPGTSALVLARRRPRPERRARPGARAARARLDRRRRRGDADRPRRPAALAGRPPRATETAGGPPPPGRDGPRPPACGPRVRARLAALLVLGVAGSVIALAALLVVGLAGRVVALAARLVLGLGRALVALAVRLVARLGRAACRLAVGLSACRALPALRAQLRAEHDLAAAVDDDRVLHASLARVNVRERAVELPTPLRLVLSGLYLKPATSVPPGAPSLQTPSCSWYVYVVFAASRRTWTLSLSLRLLSTSCDLAEVAGDVVAVGADERERPLVDLRLVTCAERGARHERHRGHDEQCDEPLHVRTTRHARKVGNNVGRWISTRPDRQVAVGRAARQDARARRRRDPRRAREGQRASRQAEQGRQARRPDRVQRRRDPPGGDDPGTAERRLPASERAAALRRRPRTAAPSASAASPRCG